MLRQVIRDCSAGFHKNDFLSTESDIVAPCASSSSRAQTTVFLVARLRERSDAIQAGFGKNGLLRRVAPRKDDVDCSSLLAKTHWVTFGSNDLRIVNLYARDIRTNSAKILFHRRPVVVTGI